MLGTMNSDCGATKPHTPFQYPNQDLTGRPAACKGYSSLWLTISMFSVVFVDVVIVVVFVVVAVVVFVVVAVVVVVVVAVIVVVIVVVAVVWCCSLLHTFPHKITLK